MRRRTYATALVIAVVAAFGVGLWRGRGSASRDDGRAQGAGVQSARSSALGTPTEVSPYPDKPRFPPPPLPTNDPGVAEIVNGPDEPAEAVVRSRNEDLDRRMEELFGKDFPREKREAVFAAQKDWIREHGRAVRAYYRGYISQGELTDRIHKNMLIFARKVQAALSEDEYRRLMDLEPGADPFEAMIPMGTQAGDPLADDPTLPSDPHPGEH